MWKTYVIPNRGDVCKYATPGSRMRKGGGGATSDKKSKRARRRSRCLQSVWMDGIVCEIYYPTLVVCVCILLFFTASMVLLPVCI